MPLALPPAPVAGTVRADAGAVRACVCARLARLPACLPAALPARPRHLAPPARLPGVICGGGFCDCAAQHFYLHQRREVPNGERGANQMAD